jgi:hypothetical protein
LSTILKALKRIDQTTPPPDDLQSGLPGIDTKAAVRGRLYRIWLLRKVVLALILVAVVIAAGWLVYSQKDLLISKIGSKRRSDKPPVFQAKIEPPSRQSQGPVPQQAASRNRQMMSSGVKLEREGISAERPPQASPQRPLEQKSQTNPRTTLTPQIQAPETKSSAKSTISRRPAVKARSSDQGTIRPAAPAPAKRSKSRAGPAARSYPRLDDTKLKLQAIAWSNDASQRIAVINDRIVREGESVEGYSINQIRQEDVVVNDGSQSWQLEFGLR